MNRRSKATRRRFLFNTGFLVAGWELSSAGVALLAATPDCRDGDEPTAPETEGPFFKPKSPQRSDLREPATKGKPFELSGYVLTKSCRPVRGAVVDLWHADENGEYDNIGFRYRGHVITEPDGAFRFHTIVPALYPGRTRHYHLKVLSTGRQLLTTQLYFPNEPMNSRDDFFDQALLMKVAEGGEAVSARFDFVLNLR